MSVSRFLSVLVFLSLGVQSGATQTAVPITSNNTPPNSPNRSTMSIAVSADGDQDRYGTLTLQRGNWALQNINWTNPNGQFALSLLLMGRQFKLSRWADASVLAGPWFSYGDHAWNEMVLDTNFTFHKERFRVACTNHWGLPLRNSGGFFDSHIQTMTGLTGLPTWLGFSLLEKYSGSAGLERLFFGPVLMKREGAINVSAYPYWDVQRRTLDLRLGLSYSRTTPKSERK
jgi:hypothetical protein